MSTEQNVVNDPDVEGFLTAPLNEKFGKALDDKLAPKLRDYLGQEAYDELHRLAAEREAARKGHLGMNIPPNLIFIPGVMGSLLSRGRGGVW